MMNPSEELAFNFSADNLDIINKDADIVGQMCCLKEAHKHQNNRSTQYQSWHNPNFFF